MKKEDKIKDAIKLLKQQQDNLDTELAHVEADNIICALLIQLGYGEVVDEFEKINKWYA